MMAAGARPRGRSLTATDTRILAGKLRDETGDLLTPTHTRRHGRRFAYYISNVLIAGGTDPSGWRLPAAALETSLRAIVTEHLRQSAAGHSLLAEPDARDAADLMARATALSDRVAEEPALLASMIASGTFAQGNIHLRLDSAAVAATLDVSRDLLSERLLQIACPFALRRRSVETRIIAGEMMPAPDQVLPRTLAEAHVWVRELRAGRSLIDIARKTGHSTPYLRTRLPLAFLAPRVQAAILDGRQPTDLSVAQIIREDLSMDWGEQARLFGLG
jgi:site-specific DNA recombinase